MAVRAAESDANAVLDAAGPEVYSFNRLVKAIAAAVGRRPLLLHLPPSAALALSGAIGAALGDVLLTRDEVEGLMAGLLVSSHPPTGATRLSAWMAQHAQQLGTRYASELKRHYR